MSPQPKSPTAPVAAVPHDWTFKTWPLGVYPYNGRSGRHLVNQNRERLVAAGALVRVGRTLVILSAGYTKWMAAQAPRVCEFDVPANRAEHAQKRFGRGEVCT